MEMSIQIVVADEAFEINGEDGPQVALRFFVYAETSKGRRFRHNFSFPSVEQAEDPEYGFYLRNTADSAVEKAENLAARIREHLAAAGSLDAKCWSEMAPAYGSEAFIAFDAEVIAPAMDHLRHGGSVDDLPRAVRAYL